MKLEILQVSEVDNLNEFIEFWKKQYFYNGENTYDDIIEKEYLLEDDLKELYIWKNGTPLSAKKQLSFEVKILSKLDLINNWKEKGFKLELFLEEFKDVSFVWKIFLLHKISPNSYPIYDQHIHRAFNKINNLEWENISNTISNKIKENFYFNTYLGFLELNKVNDLRKLDKAFFAYGQFLNSKIGKADL